MANALTAREHSKPAPPETGDKPQD
jgi:hypothetical protein